MGRGSRSGPAAGGQVILPMWNKRAASGTRVECGVALPFDARLVAVFAHTTVANSNYSGRLGGTPVAANETGTTHFAQGSVGSASGGEAAFTTDSARDGARGDIMDLELVGGASGVHDISAHCVVACRGFTTDDEADD